MTEEEKNIEMQVRISARLGVLKNLGQDKGDATFVAKIEEELEWLCSLFDCKKDLALTIEDIELLHTFLYAIKNNKHGCFTFTRLSDGQYEEVLRRFRETKNK